MKKFLPVEELARDERFVRVAVTERFTDPRPAVRAKQKAERAARGETRPERDARLTPDHWDSPDRSRSLMHGIFVGEIQALEGAGRTCWDFEVGKGPDDVPFELKLDMARQCWDEARHCEISVKLGDHMGSRIGEFAESTTLFEAACHEDPVFRLAGVNRALEGLAIDVFTTMRDFAQDMADPTLEFCEDWMLADEVTHVKMGSTWLRTVTEGDPDRRQAALEYQRTVDKLFNFRGRRGEESDAAIRLARRFREMAGFDTSEIDVIAADAAADAAAGQAPVRAGVAAY